MKIDLVYTWVDGTDKKWLAKKNAALLSAGKDLPKSATVANRWTDNDELLYSLRSAEKFAPWINHIYIITDGSHPKWLDTKNSKITVVDHTEIIPAKLLPTFNSLAIEMFMWNIPGLSEHFLYANDDMFFGRGVSPDFFFDINGNPIVMIKERKMPAEFIVKKSWYLTRINNAIKFVKKHFGQTYNLSFVHAIEPVRKSYMRENFMQFEKEFSENTGTQFRELRNIQRIVFPIIDNAKGRNTLVLDWRVGKNRIVYYPKKDSALRRGFHTILRRISKTFGFMKYDLLSTASSVSEKLKKHQPKTFCINDSKAAGENFSDAAKYMTHEFSKKSRFEK